MRYSVELHRDAERYVSRLDRRRQKQIAASIDQLAQDPFDPELSKPLHGKLSGLRSCRVADLRILFDVVSERLLVHIVDIGPRGDVHKR